MLRPSTVVAAVVAVVAVVVLLAPSTPGPVLGAAGRLALGAVVGLLTLAGAHRLLQRPAVEPDDPLHAVRAVVASLAIVVTATMVLAFLLAAVVGTTGEVGDTAGGLNSSLPIDRPLLIGGVLLLIGVLAAGLSHRASIPGALLFLGLGMAVGDEGLGWITLNDPALVQSLGVGALVIILFNGGLTTDVRRLREGIGPGLSLATVGVGVTAGITALSAAWLLDLPTSLALLLGAIVASTDAAVVMAILRVVPVPERVAATLQVESGTNDPVAVLLTIGLLAGSGASFGDWVMFGALQMIGGVIVGAAVGGAGGWLLRQADLGGRGLYPVLALAIGGTAYGAAVAIGSSGFLAVYVAGIVVALEAPRWRSSVRNFHAALASGTEVGLFLLLGLLVQPSRLIEVAHTAVGVVALLLFVARPVAAWVSLAPFRRSPREVTVVAWLGMRGAVPIVLATLPFSAGVPGSAMLFDIVFFVVLLSALVQGATAAPLVRRLGMVAAPDPGRAVVEAVPGHAVGVDVIHVTVSAGSPLSGRPLRDCRPPRDHLVVAVVRGDAVVVPDGNTRLRGGDQLVVIARRRAEDLAALEAWASPGQSAAALEDPT